MTPPEKRQQRFKVWLDAEDVNFTSAAAKKAYKQKVQRLSDAYNVTEPDRVPVALPVGALPAYLYGTDYYHSMYDYELSTTAWEKFNLDFKDADTLSSPAMLLPGKVYDLLDYHLYKWPGHGLSKNAEGIQYVEGEYVKANDYDALIKNPSDFWMRVYLPRVLGVFESWTKLNPWTDIIEVPAAYLGAFGDPEVQASLRKLIRIGNEISKHRKIMGEFTRKITGAGFPSVMGALAIAPFDTIGDTLRGTQGVIFDMYRQPDKLLEAINVITTLTIDSIKSAARNPHAVAVSFPLHKGADGWMSDKQFDKFYWPSLRKVIQACIDEGLLVKLFAEGSYNTRLESVNEFPKGAVAWEFDQSDMARAKKILGGKCCISGNVPTSLMVTGTPQDVKKVCKNLIETCSRGGGYILSGGAHIDNGNAENLYAMLDAAKEYGLYKK
jgi:hypothetical protein